MDAQCWHRRGGSSILRTGFGIPSQSSDLGSGKLSQSRLEWDFSGKAGWVEGDMVAGGCMFREMASLMTGVASSTRQDGGSQLLLWYLFWGSTQGSYPGHFHS